jgi:hypothetical protein
VREQVGFKQLCAFEYRSIYGFFSRYMTKNQRFRCNSRDRSRLGSCKNVTHLFVILQEGSC